MYIEILDVAEDRLKRVVYRFGVREMHSAVHVVLGHYAVQTRPSRRHHWVTKEWYSRLSSRDASIKSEPIVPAAILEQALAQVRQAVVFKTWEDSRRGV